MTNHLFAEFYLVGCNYFLLKIFHPLKSSLCIVACYMIFQFPVLSVVYLTSISPWYVIQFAAGFSFILPIEPSAAVFISYVTGKL